MKCYIEIHIDVPQLFPLHIELNLKAGCWKKCVCSRHRWYAYIITTVCFITLHIYIGTMIKSFHTSGKFLLVPNRINESMDFRANCSTLNFNQFCWDFINTWWLVSFNLSIPLSTSGTSGCAVCISVRLTSWSLHLATLLWESVTKSPFSSFTIFVLGS